MRSLACVNPLRPDALLRSPVSSALIRILMAGWMGVLLSGCSTLHSFHKSEQQQVLKSELFPPFSSNLLQKFDLSVDVLGKHFNGMLLIKRSGDSAYRTVFTAYTGPTLFDMYFSPSGFVMDNCISELNKKNTLHLFSTFFSSLFLTPVDSMQGGRVYASDTVIPKMAYRFKAKGQRYEFITDTRNQYLTDITMRGVVSKYIFRLGEYRDRNVGSVSFRYKGLIGVQMTLKRLE